MKKTTLEPNKIFAELEAAAVHGVTMFAGYVGTPVRAAYVRLHSSFESPGEYIEIPDDGIVHHEADPDPAHPQRVLIWVKNSSIVLRTFSVPASELGAMQNPQLLASGLATLMPTGPTGGSGGKTQTEKTCNP